MVNTLKSDLDITAKIQSVEPVVRDLGTFVEDCGLYNVEKTEVIEKEVESCLTDLDHVAVSGEKIQADLKNKDY